MLTPGHLAISYLISQTPRLVGYETPLANQIYIIAWGNLLDLDILLSRLFLRRMGNHHFLFTHTPVAASLIYLFSLVFTAKYFSLPTLLLGWIALFVHLVLDDISHWFYKLGLNQEVNHPQIFWLYPFDKRRKEYLAKIKSGEIDYPMRKILRIYFFQSLPNVFLELILIILALGVWLNKI